MAVRRVVDDVATAGKAELEYRRKVARANGSGVGQRFAVVSALSLTAFQHGTIFTPLSPGTA